MSNLTRIQRNHELIDFYQIWFLMYWSRSENLQRKKNLSGFARIQLYHGLFDCYRILVQTYWSR